MLRNCREPRQMQSKFLSNLQDGGTFANLPSDFFPSGARPFPTSPFSLRSMCQLSVSPFAFLRVNAMIAAPSLMAACCSFLSAVRESLMTSKAAEAG